MALNYSIREVAQERLSLESPFSVVRDVFQYKHGPAPRRIMSLGQRLRLLEGLSFDINLILVGWANFTGVDLREVNHGLQVAREIYDQADICIRRISWQQISVAEAGSYVTIDSGDEAHDLTDDYNGINEDYHDVFVVRNMNGAWGWSWADGPCSQDHAWKMTGSVISLNGNNDETGVVFAHEMGHYLGASADEPGSHSSDPNNLMFATVATGGTNTTITNEQADDMRSHCYLEGIFSDI